MLLASHKNRLVSSPAYPKILHQYNERLQRDGKVNDKKFYEEVVLRDLPGYHLQSWYQFLKRFKTDHGIIPAETVKSSIVQSEAAEVTVATTLLDNKTATANLIQAALNISAAAAQRIIENPQLLSDKERIEIGLKAMKAQDSRIHAIGKVREESREQEKFDRAFSKGAYGE